jgi:hypothetical protein
MNKSIKNYKYGDGERERERERNKYTQGYRCTYI